MKKYTSLTAMLLALSANVDAAIIQSTSSGLLNVTPGANFTFTLEGDAFTTPADGGGFTLSWDASVLNYVSTAIKNPPWDTSSVEATAAKAHTSNKVDYIFISTSGVAQGPKFQIADFTFNFIGKAGDSSPITFADAFGGWTTTGSVPIANVSYANIQIAAVPLPAAFLLFASGLLGLRSFARKPY